MTAWSDVTLYDLAKDIALPIVIGGIGFGSVAYTLFQTARLTREQHAREVNYEQRALRVALLAELESNHDSFQHNLKTALDTQPGGGILMPMGTETNVYDTHVARIGLLALSQIRSTMCAYARLKTYPERVRLAVGLVEGPPQEDLGQLHVPSKVIPFMTSLMEHVVSDTAKAIEDLKSKASNA